MEKYLAKQNCSSLNKYLDDHTKMVVNIAYAIADRFYTNINWDETGEFSKETFISHLLFCAVTHDIGKITDNFQKMLNKESDDTKKHNLYSWTYVTARFNDIFGSEYNDIRSAILYHHTIKENNDSVSTLWSEIKNNLKDFDYFYKSMESYIKDTFNIDLSDEFEFKLEKKIKNLPNNTTNNETIYMTIEKDMSNRIKSAKMELLRAFLIYADRLVSSGDNSNEINLQKIIDNDKDYIKSIINKKFTEVNSIKLIDIEQCGYDMERLQAQIDAVNFIESHNRTMLTASAGSGKTLIGLLWFLKHNKKITWVMPRNIITSMTYDSVVKELIQLGQTDVKVAAYYTGKFEKTNFDSSHMTDDEIIDTADILITNIDSILNRNIKNNDSHHMINTYSSYIIFDEYHENMTSKEPLCAAFINLLWTRCYLTKTKTLLMSASPVDINMFFGEECKFEVYNKLPVHNGNMKIVIDYQKLDSIDNLLIDFEDSFTYCPSIRLSQEAKIVNDTATLLHSMFTKEHRLIKEENIMNNHGKHSIVSERNPYIGTNVFGTGLDASSQHAYDLPISPEDTIQRVGRCGRFGEYQEVHYHLYEIDDNGVDYLISDMYSKKLHDKWIETLRTSDIHTKNDLYEVYYKFINDNKSTLMKLYKNKFFDSNKELVKLKPFSNKLCKSENKLTNRDGFRGAGTSIYSSVIDEHGKEQLIVIDSSKLYNVKNNLEYNRNYVLVTKKDFYPNANKLKYAYKIHRLEDFTINNLCMFANDPNTPVPLKDSKYTFELGLIIE